MFLILYMRSNRVSNINDSSHFNNSIVPIDKNLFNRSTNVNIKYNTHQSNKPSNLYLRRNTKIYPIDINESSISNYNEKKNSLVYQSYQKQSMNEYLKKFESSPEYNRYVRNLSTSSSDKLYNDYMKDQKRTNMYNNNYTNNYSNSYNTSYNNYDSTITNYKKISYVNDYQPKLRTKINWSKEIKILFGLNKKKRKRRKSKINKNKNNKNKHSVIGLVVCGVIIGLALI
jgi:hypothetical protein